MKRDFREWGYHSFGLAGVQNVGEGIVNSIIGARKKDGAFKSISDLLERIDSKGLNSRACESLIRCGAMDSFGYNRRQLIEVLPQALNNASVTRSDRESGQLSLFGGEIKAKQSFIPIYRICRRRRRSIRKENCLGFM